MTTQDQLDRIEKQLEKIEDYITGNGTPERGIFVRLDRIEEREKSRKWSFHLVASTAVAALAGFIFEYFNKK